MGGERTDGRMDGGTDASFIQRSSKRRSHSIGRTDERTQKEAAEAEAGGAREVDTLHASFIISDQRKRPFLKRQLRPHYSPPKSSPKITLARFNMHAVHCTRVYALLDRSSEFFDGGNSDRRGP